ncbi:MAG: FHA domain-containing protein [Myxococcales bacterium]|nr:FHA domain-containing protein [Myxococcales bacterium]
MPTADRPMLFIPPEPPLALRPDATLVIGRSRSCDLRLPTGDASRRHAEIIHSEGSYWVRDLASTNGTYVNGTRITEHSLAAGDRIEIGSSEIRYCQVGAGLDETPSMSDIETGEAKTIIAERPAFQVFRGELAEIPPFAVLQILEMGRKTGILKLETDQGVGTLWFAEGAPVHAESKNQIGFDAALTIIQASAGQFTFEPLTTAPEPTIAASVTELLLEASRLLDEAIL